MAFAANPSFMQIDSGSAAVCCGRLPCGTESDMLLIDASGCARLDAYANVEYKDG